MAIAAVAIVGGATGMGGGDPKPAPKKTSKQPVSPTKDSAAAAVHKLMKQAAKKSTSKSTSNSVKIRATQSVGECTRASAIQACIEIWQPYRNSPTSVQAFARSKTSHKAVSVAVQKYGAPVSWPKVCKWESRCSHTFQGGGRYRVYASYLDGTVWSYPTVSRYHNT